MTFGFAGAFICNCTLHKQNSCIWNQSRIQTCWGNDGALFTFRSKAFPRRYKCLLAPWLMASITEGHQKNMVAPSQVLSLPLVASNSACPTMNNTHPKVFGTPVSFVGLSNKPFPGFPGGSVVKNPPASSKTWVCPWVRKIPWRRKWQPTLVFLPQESHGQRGLVGYSP